MINFEHISHLFLMFLLLTLNKQMLVGILSFYFLPLVLSRCSGVFIVNFEHIDVVLVFLLLTLSIFHIFLVFLLLTLSK